MSGEPVVLDRNNIFKIRQDVCSGKNNYALVFPKLLKKSAEDCECCKSLFEILGRVPDLSEEDLTEEFTHIPIETLACCGKRLFEPFLYSIFVGAE